MRVNNGDDGKGGSTTSSLQGYERKKKKTPTVTLRRLEIIVTFCNERNTQVQGQR